MKKYFGILILLISAIANGQILSGILTDFETELPIHLANVAFMEKDKGTYTNVDGKFELNVEGAEQILFSSIGYENQIIDVTDIQDFDQILTIKLRQSTENLQEVLISSKKLKYTSSIKLGKPKKLKVRSSLPFGYEFANLIQNPKNQNGILEQVILNLNKTKDFDYLATYNIKFYEYNPITKQPENSLHFENLIIVPENKTYELKIDVVDLKIPFPENGICIGVEIVNDKYDEPIKSMAVIAPKINFTHTKMQILTWSRFRNKDWSVRTRKSQFRDDFINGFINIKVKFEK